MSQSQSEQPQPNEYTVYADDVTHVATVHKSTCLQAKRWHIGPYRSVGDAMVAGIEQKEGIEVVRCCLDCFTGTRVVLLAVT